MENLPVEIKILALLTAGFLITVIVWKIREMWKRNDLYTRRW